ncbi:hypothetical protein REPUB_Repub01dG0144800 [Reevesia pubescens]
MELPDSKKVKHDGNKRDRLSELSNDILIGILSSLPSREAVGACFLSPRWQHLWKFLPVSFRFDGTKTEDCFYWGDVLDVKIQILKTERCKFVGWVNNVLNSHQGSIIDELSIRYDLDKDWGSDINKWIDIALRKHVKKLELDFKNFRCPRDDNMYCPFPRECFSRLTTSSGLSGTQFLTCLSLQSLGEQLWSFPNLTPKLINLRQLTCKVKSFHGKSILGLASLIEDSPFLHKVKVEIFNRNEIDTRVKSAIMLEKIVVDTRSQRLLFLEAEESMEFVETLQQMAKTLAHKLLEDGPKRAEFIILTERYLVCDDDDDRYMEANWKEIMKEERRQDDEEQLKLIEEEERHEIRRMAKKHKLRNH